MSGSLYQHAMDGTTPHMRGTPAGQQTVPQIVRPGMTIRTSYGTGGIVVDVRGPYTYMRQLKHPPNWSILYVLPQHYGRHGHIPMGWSENPKIHGINEIVAVDGRLLTTCGQDEVFIVNATPATAINRAGQIEMAL